MTETEPFTLEAARRAAADDDLARWVRRFLGSDGSDNQPLGEMLHQRGLHWIGPVELLISRLNRLAGPEGDPVLVPVGDDYWRDDVDDLEARVERGWEPPPVVVTYERGQLKLEDGNHRVEAIRRTGDPTTWAVVGFATTDERDRFIAESPPVDDASLLDPHPE